MILAQATPAVGTGPIAGIPHIESLWLRIIVLVAAYLLTSH